MANKYKDDEGHFTTKENDGGPCLHNTGSSPKDDDKKSGFDDEYDYDNEITNFGNKKKKDSEEDKFDIKDAINDDKTLIYGYISQEDLDNGKVKVYITKEFDRGSVITTHKELIKGYKDIEEKEIEL